MPYIGPFERAQYDIYINNLVSSLEGSGFRPGHISYVITRMVLDVIKREGKSYMNYSEIVGVLECVKLELYRRAIGKYENKKIQESGDVFGDKR